MRAGSPPSAARAAPPLARYVMAAQRARSMLLKCYKASWFMSGGRAGTQLQRRAGPFLRSCASYSC